MAHPPFPGSSTHTELDLLREFVGSACRFSSRYTDVAMPFQIPIPGENTSVFVQNAIPLSRHEVDSLTTNQLLDYAFAMGFPMADVVRMPLPNDPSRPIICIKPHIADPSRRPFIGGDTTRVIERYLDAIIRLRGHLQVQGRDVSIIVPILPQMSKEQLAAKYLDAGWSAVMFSSPNEDPVQLRMTVFGCSGNWDYVVPRAIEAELGLQRQLDNINVGAMEMYMRHDFTSFAIDLTLLATAKQPEIDMRGRVRTNPVALGTDPSIQAYRYFLTDVTTRPTR